MGRNFFSSVNQSHDTMVRNDWIITTSHWNSSRNMDCNLYRRESLDNRNDDYERNSKPANQTTEWEAENREYQTNLSRTISPHYVCRCHSSTPVLKRGNKRRITESSSTSSSSDEQMQQADPATNPQFFAQFAEAITEAQVIIKKTH